MRRYPFWVLTLFGLFLHTIVYGAEAGRTGIVKGTITIGGRPTSDAVVSVEGVAEEKLETQSLKVKASKAVMNQHDLKFVPRVLPVQGGTTVNFPNNDKTWHNVFSASTTKKFNLGLYPAGESRNVTFGKPGVVRILCNVHPNMEAHIVVKGHPFFTVPNTRGSYRIDAVPMGKYRLEVWHPQRWSTLTWFARERFLTLTLICTGVSRGG